MIVNTRLRRRQAARRKQEKRQRKSGRLPQHTRADRRREAAAAGGEPALKSFITGLRADQDAVTAGLTLRWNSGCVEGHVNRIKMLKRQMYGRANPDLLRLRVLLAD